MIDMESPIIGLWWLYRADGESIGEHHFWEAGREHSPDWTVTDESYHHEHLEFDVRVAAARTAWRGSKLTTELVIRYYTADHPCWDCENLDGELQDKCKFCNGDLIIQGGHKSDIYPDGSVL